MHISQCAIFNTRISWRIRRAKEGKAVGIQRQNRQFQTGNLAGTCMTRRKVGRGLSRPRNYTFISVETSETHLSNRGSTYTYLSCSKDTTMTWQQIQFTSKHKLDAPFNFSFQNIIQSASLELIFYTKFHILCSNIILLESNIFEEVRPTIVYIFYDAYSIFAKFPRPTCSQIKFDLLECNLRKSYKWQDAQGLQAAIKIRFPFCGFEFPSLVVEISVHQSTVDLFYTLK